MSDHIKTIKSKTESKFKEKGSLFEGYAYPVSSSEEAENILSEIKKKYYDATHHCFAYQIMDENPRYSDDGEPSGTAGIRILNAINHFELVNVLVVSVRYYGGTKLGVGPLGKAYYKSAFDTLSLASVLTKRKFLKAKITYDFDLTSKVHHLLSMNTTNILDNTFEKKPAIIFTILEEEFKKFESEIIESTSNRAHLIVIENNLFLS